MTDPRNWTEADVNEYLKRFTHRGIKATDAVDIAVCSPDLEPAIHGNAKGPDESKNIHSKYRIHVHSRRRRLTDSDGISAKAAIDGLVAGGLLGDDNSAWVESVTFSQSKSDTEETVIEVWEILSK